jgi:AraC family transcriptional regulator of adaptative response / DNA-3-methyladenine glycosylase II
MALPTLLDRDQCARARVARDRRYDGRFFSGVRTTRVYCRPVCPVRPAKGRNVVFFATAAAAEAAGFRPCLRCRSETAPFSPARQGSRATVHRAMCLLDETTLPMIEVAERAGFASLRRFNAVFADVYGQTPSAVRRLRFKPA